VFCNLFNNCGYVGCDIVVLFVDTKVSEEHAVFREEGGMLMKPSPSQRNGEQGMQEKRRLLWVLSDHILCNLLVWPDSPQHGFTPKMACLSKMLESTDMTAQCPNPEDHDININFLFTQFWVAVCYQLLHKLFFHWDCSNCFCFRSYDVFRYSPSLVITDSKLMDLTYM